jgi:hypothetical protein
MAHPGKEGRSFIKLQQTIRSMNPANAQNPSSSSDTTAYTGDSKSDMPCTYPTQKATYAG